MGTLATRTATAAVRQQSRGVIPEILADDLWRGLLRH